MRNKEYFGVKILYKSIYGEPNYKLIDDNFNHSKVSFEESVILISAHDFEESFRIAEEIAISNENEYTNIYGQKVNVTFYGFIDSFKIFDNALVNGVELYSNMFTTTEQQMKEILDLMYENTRK